MRLLVSCLWLLAIFAALALRVPVVAQEAEVEPSGAQAVKSEVDIEAQSPEEDRDSKKTQAKLWEAERASGSSGPDIYHLPDANGNLRRVLGFRYEDFLKAWQQKDNAKKTTPPKYLLDSIRVSGTANDSHVNLQIELTIHPRVDDWIDIPLELPALVVQQWEIDGQTEEECLVFDAKRESYVLWLKSESTKPRTLKLQGLSKLKLAPTNPALELKLPYATTSEFVLQVPIADAQFEASPGIDVETTAGEDGGTRVRLTGQARPLRLQWKSSEQQKPSSNTVVEAVGKLRVQIDQHRASYDVELKINSYGDPVERLRVRLPVGAKLTGENLPEEYQVVGKTLDAEHGDIVEIELPEPRSEPWTLQLSAEQSRGNENPASEEDATYHVTGFEVLDAFRQSGTLALYVEEPLQAYFDLSGDIEQTPKQKSSQSISSGAPMSSFAYARFPWTLEAHTLERQLRVSVKPQYEMQLKQGEADLQVQFEYQFAGAKTFAVRIDMRGWELSDSAIESEGAIDQERIFEKPGGLLVLPLVNPNVERLQLRMTARRSVPLGHRTIPLPVAQEAFVLPGQLRVEADPSLQVTPTIIATEGVSVVTDLADAEEPPLDSDFDRGVLTLRTFLPRAALGAEIKLRERQVAVEVETRVDVDQQTVRVLQQFMYQVKYRPTSLLLLRIPKPLWNNDSLKVQLDGEDLPFHLGVFSKELPRDEDSVTPESPPVAVRQLRISLPRPRQDDFQLDLTYEMPCPDLAAEALSPLELPLISPNDLVQANGVGVYPAKPIRATLNQTADKGPWSARTESEALEADTTALQTTSLQMKGNGKPTAIPLFLQLESKQDLDLPTLENAWLQTWIVGERQQIRAVFLFRTSQQTVVVQLPPSLRNPNMEVLLDGSPSEFKWLTNNRVAIPLPATKQGGKHTLELRYQLEASLAGWRVLHASLPRLECRSNLGHVFWQLVLPRGWHVANGPSQLTAEYQIGWNHTRWGRQPTRDQTDLEDSTGATTAPKPPASSNQYLYSGFAIPDEVRVLVISHLWLMVTCILAAFGMGMLLIATSVAKHVSFWLLLALALAAGAFSYPEFTFLAVQAVFWGGVMTLAATLLKKAFASPPRPGYVLAPAAQSASTAVTESWIRSQSAMPSGEGPHGEKTDKEIEATSIQAGGPVL
ncbi:MAG: hypothetical protein GXP28_07500 [Planctomycetes bacterium]|nr:hypothetical protein [Planctomycetota bacterium]